MSLKTRSKKLFHLAMKYFEVMKIVLSFLKLSNLQPINKSAHLLVILTKCMVSLTFCGIDVPIQNMTLCQLSWDGWSRCKGGGGLQASDSTLDWERYFYSSLLFWKINQLLWLQPLQKDKLSWVVKWRNKIQRRVRRQANACSFFILFY